MAEAGKKTRGGRAAPAARVKADRRPVVRECPLNIECRVREALALGCHTLFLAEVLAVQVDPALLDGKGRLCRTAPGCWPSGTGSISRWGAAWAGSGSRSSAGANRRRPDPCAGRVTNWTSR